MITKLDWIVIIKGDTYEIEFSTDSVKMPEGAIQIERMYGLNRNDMRYVLAILSNGTFRLYSKAIKKLYLKGKSSSLRWIPKTVKSEMIH